MAISASAYWRVRINGLDTNGGGFDPSIAGAGSDYTDQDTPQLALTDLASASPYTTVTSASGGFTSAMVGNAIRIASGTGFTAGVYFVTAVTDGNTAVVDRACATAAASGGVAKLGGAFASVLTPSGPVAGNVVFVRGQGSNDPADIDYVVPASAANSYGSVSYVGYNGRPKLGHTGKIWNYSTFDTTNSFMNLYFVQTAATTTNQGVFWSSRTNFSQALNCVFDQGGIDATQATNLNLDRCSFINTGNSTAGTKPATQSATIANNAFSVLNCLFKDLRGSAISLNGIQGIVTGNVVMNCAGDGIVMQGDEYYKPIMGVVSRNTVYNCRGHGIHLKGANFNKIYENLICNITGDGKYGLYLSTAPANASILHSQDMASNNFYACTNNCNVSLPTSSLTVDPQFVSADDLTPTNLALRLISGVGSL